MDVRSGICLGRRRGPPRRRAAGARGDGRAAHRSRSSAWWSWWRPGAAAPPRSPPASVGDERRSVSGAGFRMPGRGPGPEQEGSVAGAAGLGSLQLRGMLCRSLRFVGPAASAGTRTGARLGCWRLRRRPAGVQWWVAKHRVEEGRGAPGRARGHTRLERRFGMRRGS